MSAPARILVVDDHAPNVELVSFVLDAAGFEVHGAVDAEQALDRLAQWRPDLILMDIQLPGIDGLSLTRRLKADDATRSIRVVAMTAHAMRGDEARLREAGCDGYIAKPIDVATLPDRVRALLAPS